MDRIKKLSIDVLSNYRNDFGTDFIDNKTTLKKISVIRSKGLQNELAGYITKFIKNELRQKKEKEDRIAQDKLLANDDNTKINEEESTASTTKEEDTPTITKEDNTSDAPKGDDTTEEIEAPPQKTIEV